MLQPFWKLIKSLKFNYLALFLIGLSTILLFSLMYGSIKKETYELKSLQISPDTIRSLKTVEDTVKTEQERERAALEVGPVYQFSEEVEKNRQAIAASLFDILAEVKSSEKKTKDESDELALLRKEQVAEMRKKLAGLEEEEPGLRLSDEALSNLLSLEKDVLLNIKQVLVSIMGVELSKPIRAADLSSSRYEVERKIRLSDSIPQSVLQSVLTLGRSLVVETEKVNDSLTKVRIEQARESVEPTRILQGQVIVREGQMIDRDVYRQLELTGLLTNKLPVKPIAGLSLFVLFISSIIFMHFSTWQESGTVKKKALLIVLTIFFLLVILMKLLSVIEKDFDVLLAFLFPTALAPMLVKLLTNERLALMITIITAATAGVMLQEGYAAIIQMEVALYILFGGIVSLYLLGNGGKRSSILRTSVGVSVSNMLFIAFYLLMTQSSYDLSELAFYLIAAITSGILSGALTIGLMPFFESAFGLLSDMRLIELSNPNHPLLKKVLIETPGTYHHSVMVANLSDAACEVIGAHGLLARVGSYYHDIGKTQRAGFFIENQHAGQNPHDSLSPIKSRDIIIAHVEDGVKILEKHKMPSEIIDIAKQHHGTTLLKYFYVKAKESEGDVNEDDFRYAGPKPQTKEIAIILVADSVEAAVRSMKEPTPEKIAKLVRAIINDKLNDGQFDECDLSMKELKAAEKVFCETLNGTFHNRIEYPD
ncbi:HD family phosphohydrolase [Sporosarcina limicola]|uniref:Nucleotidyltransferase with HDIG domain n=1 Tax=Sporosarcina limicola TaxID=34101 RepID=A0A927MH70_9BACL|nr:HD family phosphohydrolase [Sporosarcina limicola]MBE1553716.1 putative nucleotidyltransferase with HDIG domain [Sporosarcina limicola]